MLHAILNAPWQQAFDVLAAGQPPMILRILAINTLFFILFLMRRTRGISSMPSKVAIAVQSTLLVINMMILYQDEIMRLMHKVI